MEIQNLFNFVDEITFESDKYLLATALYGVESESMDKEQKEIAQKVKKGQIKPSHTKQVIKYMDIDEETLAYTIEAIQNPDKALT